MIITFCGHSTYSPTREDEETMLRLFGDVSRGQQITFYLGGYGSFDEFAKRCAKQYQATHPSTKVCFISPYIGKWLEDRKEYLQREYDEIIYPEIETTPPKFAITKRNEWMVDHADYVIAYVSRQYGGAYTTLQYAHKHKKPYTNIHVGTYEL